ncbi:MAG: hypothetical protein LAKADJCE_00479 [Candidatus Argoarchaeum ethanivorans]|uniref:Uncharacterized protein n=1 Tax=Candidatus Argoarchaeum ethanivorans TaxID=2608793 RepID=A0A811T796_9EURY|nr:MAG: hypothetical protein LAKADJCE_00479 [Candidatus Argoarchaeum ethanivorans]
MGTITVNVKDEVEKEFRAVAVIIHGGRKGYLEKAVTESMQKWINEKKQEKIAEMELKLLEKGFNFGKKLYGTREELHDR